MNTSDQIRNMYVHENEKVRKLKITTNELKIFNIIKNSEPYTISISVLANMENISIAAISKVTRNLYVKGYINKKTGVKNKKFNEHVYFVSDELR